MTTANKFTLLRMILIPIMIIILYIQPLKQNIGFLSLSIGEFIFAVIFVIASLTDFLDGYIARKYDQITTFGKFLDPIADKLLVVTAFLMLIVSYTSRVPMWTVWIIIMREFIVSGVRLVAVDEGVVIAASKLGKIKTITTMIVLVLLLFKIDTLNEYVGYGITALLYIAVLITLVSGIEYVYKNRKAIFKSI